jgi:hypothetical protein
MSLTTKRNYPADATKSGRKQLCAAISANELFTRRPTLRSQIIMTRWWFANLTERGEGSFPYAASFSQIFFPAGKEQL